MRFVNLDSNNMVVDTREGVIIVEGEIQSDTGEIGQIMQPDGSFVTPVVIPAIPQPTMEERFSEVNTNQLILMDVLATMYEDMLAKGTV